MVTAKMASVAQARPNEKRLDESSLSAVKTLRKALGILDAFAFAERPLSVAEVAVRAGVTRPTAHRLVQTLVAEGYLAQDPRDGRIAPGYSVLKLAGSLLDTNRVRLEALPHLENLARASGERANLGILHRNQMLYLAGVEKPSLPTIYSRFGKTIPAYCSALGKAILAHLPERELQDYLKQETLTKCTDATITDEAALRAELSKIRAEDNIAVDREEHAVGVFCIAAAILVDGKPVAAIGLSGRALGHLLGQKEALQHTAEVISHVLSRGA
jgi:DNA-binding IclR family transcriptional regulator